MKVAVAKEIKKHEYRVAVTPSCAQEYINHGHEVLVEADSGEGAGYRNEDYSAVNAKIITDKATLFDQADMIIKVKEPLPEEFDYFHEGQILYTYLHLAADKNLAVELQKRKIIGVAYETIQFDNGMLPCLKPMSEIAGRLSIQEGAKYLEKSFGGRGILLGGVPGVRRGKVTILGGGVSGLNAAKIAVGMGAEVSILDISQTRLAYLDDIFGNTIQTLVSTPSNIEDCLRECDLLIGAVLLPGASAPKLVIRDQLKLMKTGAVIVDISVDQGGCVETTRPTTHDDPIYSVDGIIHYCVSNMPGSVALTSTLALTHQTTRFGLEIVNKGIHAAIRSNRFIHRGINLYQGKLTNQAVADSLELTYTSLDEIL